MSPNPESRRPASGRSACGSRVAVGRQLATLLFSAGVSLAGASSEPGWRPVRDEVYLQEVARRVAGTDPISCVRSHEGAVFAGTPQGLRVLEGDRLIEVPEVRGPVTRLVVAGEALWAMGPEGLHRRRAAVWQKVSGDPVTDVTEHAGGVVLLAANRLWSVAGNGLAGLSAGPCPFPAVRVVSHNATLHVLGPGRLVTLADGEFGSPNLETGKPENAWEWGEWPSGVARDLLSVGPRLWVATDRGLAMVRGMELTTVRGEDGLCIEDTTCLARGFTNDVWIGSRHGAMRMIEGRFEYLAGPRWLPNDEVRDITVLGRTVYLATGRGLGAIEYVPYTLARKAAYYQQWIERQGHQRLGFVHKLEWDEALGEYVREISDNDGGYTEDYLAAQAYRFAVTGDPEARREATNSFHAMRWLEAMTGIPGFPARSVWVKGERGHKAMHGSGGYPAEWHDTTDPRFEWKGDTSSDELCAHFYGVALFRELAARDSEPAQAAALLGRIAAHLVEHGWQLVDLDGRPTRWGRFDPEYFTRTTEGHFARGLNGLEVLSFIKTAERFTGEARFGRAYGELVRLGYPNYTIRSSVTFPPDFIAHFDDQLAFWAYWNLVRCETDPALQSVYRRSLERSFELVRVEQNPWFNFVYGVLTGNDCEVPEAVAHLREWPLDLVVHPYRNSHRADYRPHPGYSARKGGVRAFSPRETQPMRWDHWTMQPDGGSAPGDVEHPTAWLVTYWMGRYHGLIEPPDATDPAWLGAGPSIPPGSGARPYAGPPRPDGF